MEFRESIEQYRRLLLGRDVNLEQNFSLLSLQSAASVSTAMECDKDDNFIIIDDSIAYDDTGRKFSSQGPAAYQGDILEDPTLLWTDDLWDEEIEQEALQVIKQQQQSGYASQYWKEKYSNDANRFWHKFYCRNQDHFYKDRHYLHIVFPELTASSSPDGNGPLQLIEVGCGVGNSVWPLLDLNPHLQVIAVDFADSAIKIVNERAVNYINSTTGQLRIHGFVANMAIDDLPVPAQQPVDLAILLFALSAVAPEYHLGVLQRIHRVLKVNTGKLLVRDYGRYDEAQLRFKKNNLLAEHFYVRQDGTCAYFFDLEELKVLAIQAGFHIEEAYYIRRQYANRQQKKARRRVWLHLKLVAMPITV